MDGLIHWNFDALNRLLLLLTTFEFHFISRSRQIKAACINEDFTGLFCEGNRVSCLYICDVNQPNRYWLLDTKHLRCIDIDFVFWPGAIQDTILKIFFFSQVCKVITEIGVVCKSQFSGVLIILHYSDWDFTTF